MAEFLPAKGKTIAAGDVARLAEGVKASQEKRPSISKSVALELQQIEREYRFTTAARAEFQQLLGTLGLDSAFPIQIPPNREPVWAHHHHPLHKHRSSAQLPAAADVVIIGAGLTGASAAYHLR
ncbi:MAG TPA: hypothetical protein VE998_09440, partial [Terriglobales bacterium]|nr:hypothetical protein [Terriglobales bacterium]